jgi:hypothetical protein
MSASRNVRPVTVFPSNVNLPKYTVTQTKADRMVAMGQAKWIAGTRSLRETNTRVRGIRLEWRIRSSAGFAVLQLAEPRATTSWAARLANGD